MNRVKVASAEQLPHESIEIVQFDDDFDFDNHLPYCLARAANAVRSVTTPSYLAAASSQCSLGVREFRVLVIVARYGPVSPAKIAKKTGLDRATVTRALATLKDLALVHDVKNARDGRGKYIVLSKQGGDLCDQFFPLMKSKGEVIAAVFTKDEQALLLSMLNRLFEHTETLLP